HPRLARRRGVRRDHQAVGAVEERSQGVRERHAVVGPTRRVLAGRAGTGEGRGSAEDPQAARSPPDRDGCAARRPVIPVFTPSVNSMTATALDLETMAATLEQSDRYRVLRRLVPRKQYHEEPWNLGDRSRVKLGLVVD